MSKQTPHPWELMWHLNIPSGPVAQPMVPWASAPRAAVARSGTATAAAPPTPATATATAAVVPQVAPRRAPAAMPWVARAARGPGRVEPPPSPGMLGFVMGFSPQNLGKI